MPRGRKSQPLSNRFWEKVYATSECWEWIAGTDKDGYGQIWVNEKIRRARSPRVAWFLYTGEWPELCVLHTCDNRLCVKFEHLFLGTNDDNAKDRARKGRSAININPCPGEANGNAVLTDAQVTEIRIRYFLGENQVPLANEFKVTHAAVNSIICGRSWKHLPIPPKRPRVSFQAAKTHCKKGHEYTPKNTYRTKIQRHCRTCTKIAQQKYQQKKLDIIPANQ